MRCRDVQERLEVFLDGEAGMLERWQIGRHLSSCASCAAEAETQRKLARLICAADPLGGDVSRAPLPALPMRASRPLRIGLACAVPALGALALFFSMRPAAPPASMTAGAPPAAIAMASTAPASPVPTSLAAGRETSSRALAAAAPKAVAVAAAPVVRRTRARRSIAVASASETPVRRLRRAPRRDSHRRIRKAVAEAESRAVRVVSASPPESAPATSTGTFGAPPAALSAPRSEHPETDAAVVSGGAGGFGGGSGGAERVASRRRAYPVLVVTPTRYENVVYVTPAAVELPEEPQE